VSIPKRIGLAAGVVGGAAGVAYGTTRLVANRLRRAPDGDAPRALDAPAYVDHTLDSHDRGTIYVVERGNELDPPIVLSHGVTLSVRTWFYQLDELPKEGFRTIAFDHRGHGRSVLGEEGHTLDNLGRDVRTLLEGLDLHDAVLVGHSIGGVAVQAFVTQFPEIVAARVAGIVLLSTLAYTPLGSRSTRTKARLEKIMKRAPDSQWLWDSRNLGFLAARIGFGRDPRPSHVELVRSMMSECPPETRLDAPRVLVGLDLTHELPKVRVPTLVIGGTADVLTPPFEARQMARLIPGARLELLNGGGHMLMLERTEEVDKLIADFAREVQGARNKTWLPRARPEGSARPHVGRS
jgi:pimeloyl-ACP methyl ester carboxylesterase